MTIKKPDGADAAETPDTNDPTDAWFREESKNHLTSASRLKRDSIKAVLNRMRNEIPNATPYERTEWMATFRGNFPIHFDKSPQTYSRADIAKLTPTQKLDLVHTGKFPVVTERGKKKPK